MIPRIIRICYYYGTVLYTDKLRITKVIGQFSSIITSTCIILLVDSLHRLPSDPIN